MKHNLYLFCNRVLFWTDTQLGQINVADEDGRYKRTLIQGPKFQPFSIAVNPRNG